MWSSLSFIVCLYQSYTVSFFFLSIRSSEEWNARWADKQVEGSRVHDGDILWSRTTSQRYFRRDICETSRFGSRVCLWKCGICDAPPGRSYFWNRISIRMLCLNIDRMRLLLILIIISKIRGTDYFFKKNGKK